MPQNTLYPHMLSPLKLKAFELKNRIIMGAMHTRLEQMPDGSARLAAFYGERAKGGVGLILTGGHAPNEAGHLEPNGPILNNESQLADHKIVTRAVHKAGGRIALQILHAGRYGATLDIVAPSALRSPISPLTPRALLSEEVEQTIKDFADCATLAQKAGYDGVEIMGSEGYLINQFTAMRTNKREDQWGGSTENRHRFPVEIIKAIRAATGPDFALIFRLSALELVPDGASGEDIILLAQKIEQAGADILSTGIGWHEARIPTIAYMVPRGAWRFAAKRIKQAVNIPVVGANRLNTPETVEELLADGACDLAYLARPLLADPDFVNKAARGQRAEINVCIACNQACLDYIFKGRSATCLVNPRAGFEQELQIVPTKQPKRIAVIGGGAAGMAAASIAGARGHQVTLFEAAKQLGGQLLLARNIPGKQEFDELLRYFQQQLASGNVDVKTGVMIDADGLQKQGFDEIIIATGVTPKQIELAGSEHPGIASYAQILSGEKQAGERVAIIGAGGIGFDVAEFLSRPRNEPDDPLDAFFKEWGVDRGLQSAGGLDEAGAVPRQSPRQITLLQRTPGKPGRSLGFTTGWALIRGLKQRGVKILTGVTYEHIDNEGLHILLNDEKMTVPVDSIIICAGQESTRWLYEELSARNLSPHIIGGAAQSGELDALRAISQGYRLALEL